MYVYVCIYSCHYVDKNMIRITKNICRSVKETPYYTKFLPPLKKKRKKDPKERVDRKKISNEQP